ncbi:phosphatidate cytidylyltransferase [Treponema brennaborense DSM 12168]|uniref:Phosphatidate cytidylyltransferase n=2 Tax=Treponema TaxID=157 RepID=F4LPT3_TREBD|nr:phosphatidate cytidylyltransferase [Treponema brennaborense DSM 12168]
MEQWFCYKEGVEWQKHMNELLKEVFRKSIHICTAFVPLLLHAAYLPVMVLLGCALIGYCIAEALRCRGITVPLVSAITAAAARKRDENRFVLGPATLAFGVLCAALLFEPAPAAVGIFALAFGDGLASLVGKFCGRIKIPGSAGKTVAGSLTCFTAIFCSTFAVTRRADAALGVALAGMLIEVLPLKDFDNVLIPVLLGALAQFYFHI